MMKKQVLAQLINYCPQLGLHASKYCKVSWSISISLQFLSNVLFNRATEIMTSPFVHVWLLKIMLRAIWEI